MSYAPTHLDELLTPEQFAEWQQTSVVLIRRKLRTIPGVIYESRKRILIHPRTYLEKRLSESARR